MRPESLYVTTPSGFDPNNPTQYSVFSQPAFWACAGGVVGSATDSIVFNCYCGYCIQTDNRISDEGYGNFYLAPKGGGGIVGCAESTEDGIYNASIISCTSNAGVSMSDRCRYLGGVAGWIGGVAGKPAIVSRCLMRGSMHYAGEAVGLSGIVGGAASCFTIEYNRVCRPAERYENEESLIGSVNVGLAVGEVLAGGSGSDGAMYIIDNAVSADSVNAEGNPADEDGLDGVQPHVHRIVGYIPPKSVMDDGGGTLLLKNNYSSFTLVLEGSNTDVKEYELNGYTNDSGIEYSENQIATSAEYASVSLEGNHLDPVADPAYGANRANGVNMPLAYMNDVTATDCQNIASLSLCGGVGALEPLLQVKRSGSGVRSSGKGSSACADDVKDTMRGIIDSIADMEDAVNGFIGPMIPGWTNTTGVIEPIDDILAYNQLIGDDLKFAGNVNSSLQKGICCAINYIKCCECCGAEQPPSVCLVSYSKTTGDSLQGFTYTLTKEGADPPVSVTLTSGSDGTMQFDDLQPGVYHIASAGEGYPDFHTYDLTIAPNGSASLVQTSPDAASWINLDSSDDCY
ncbi:MAG: prealbumin-like fold domain-containing protein [Oscillospiraceae bacterium]|nr:prealbumin-like fold domain-containing protein [Oscillospiraceae bacterium]